MGIGGGIFFVPFLGLYLGLDPRQSRGTSLGLVACVAAVALLGHLTAYFVDDKNDALPALLVVVLVAPASIFASRRAATWLPRISVTKLQILFGVVLLMTSVKLMNEQICLFPQAAGLFRYELSWAFLVLPVLGLVVGLVAALVGVGGAILLIPAFDMLFMDFPFRRCQATALLIVLPTALFAFQRHRSQGTALIEPVLRLAPFAMLGSLAGSYLLSSQSSDATLRFVFACFVLVIGLRCIVGAVRLRGRT